MSTLSYIELCKTQRYYQGIARDAYRVLHDPERILKDKERVILSQIYINAAHDLIEHDPVNGESLLTDVGARTPARILTPSLTRDNSPYKDTPTDNILRGMTQQHLLHLVWNNYAFESHDGMTFARQYGGYYNTMHGVRKYPHPSRKTKEAFSEDDASHCLAAVTAITDVLLRTDGGCIRPAVPILRHYAGSLLDSLTARPEESEAQLSRIIGNENDFHPTLVSLAQELMYEWTCEGHALTHPVLKKADWSNRLRFKNLTTNAKDIRDNPGNSLLYVANPYKI